MIASPRRPLQINHYAQIRAWLALHGLLMISVISLFLHSPSAQAMITAIDIKSTSSYGQFQAGEFLRIEGEVTGELSPEENIPGIKQAAKNANGQVVYKSPFVIIMPKESGKGNGSLLIDVPNRGRPITHFLYNSGRENFLPLDLEPRSGFLQHQGFTVAMVQWELGQGIQLPSFKSPAGELRYAEGVGLAVIRDFAMFLRIGMHRPGRVNPLMGRVEQVLGVGYSQTARLLKTLLMEGFNSNGGRRVFDGMHIHAGASGIADVMATGKGPASSTFFTPRFTHPEHRGVTEEPLTYQDIVARELARDPSPLGSPQLLVTNGTTDYYNIRASLARTGAKGIQDLPLPANVRIYDIAGASHGRATEKTCEQLPGQLDFFPVMRSTLLHLHRWVKSDAKPPETRLMPLEPLPAEPTLLQAPAHLRGAIVQVPKRDADGNSLGGVRLPELEVPLGTHGAQNLPLSDRACNLNAAYIPFARSPADRKPDDQRASLQERYKDFNDYLSKLSTAAEALVRQGFLLKEDAETIVREAQRPSSK